MSEIGTTIACLVFGIITFIFYLITFCTQIIKLHKTKNTSGSSIGTYGIYGLTSIFGVIGSFGLYFNMIEKPVDESVPLLLKQWSLIPICVTNSLGFILLFIILFLKAKSVYLARKLHVTELDLSFKLLQQENKKTGFKKNLFLIVVFGIAFSAAVLIITLLLTLTKATYSGIEGDWAGVIVINWFSAASSELINGPQFIKSIRKRDMTGVSLGGSIFMFANCLAFLCYDVLLGMTPQGFSSLTIGSIVLCGIIPTTGVLVMKAQNVLRAKKMNLSELEYTQKYILSKTNNND